MPKALRLKAGIDALAVCWLMAVILVHSVSDMSPEKESLKRGVLFCALNLEQQLCSPAVGSS